MYQSLSSGAELWRRYASSSTSIRYKLPANVAINGMSALLETKNGFADANPYAREAARMLVEDAIVVPNACGCTLEHDAELAHAFEVARMTDETISSMVQDVTHHRETRSASSPAPYAARDGSITSPPPATICFCSWFWPSSPSIWAAEQSRRGAFGGVRRQISCRLAPFPCTVWKFLLDAERLLYYVIHSSV